MSSLLIRVDPAWLDAAVKAWHEVHRSGDSTLRPLNGKTIRDTIDGEGRQAHVLDIMGHDTKAP